MVPSLSDFLESLARFISDTYSPRSLWCFSMVTTYTLFLPALRLRREEWRAVVWWVR